MKVQLKQSTWSVGPILLSILCLSSCDGFVLLPRPALVEREIGQAPINRLRLEMASTVPKKKKGYEPKWKKKKTLAELEQESGASTPTDDMSKVGIKGTIPVVFKQGNETKTTLAMVGQPLRDVANQAGQFIKYGCGRGECGTCESLVNGKWVRPCTANIPPLPAGEEYVVTVKDVKAKVVSSGKFYSARSFVMGFWNNLLGMVGFVRYRRNAKRNRQERKEYEDLIRQKTLEKKQMRMQNQDLTP